MAYVDMDVSKLTGVQDVSSVRAQAPANYTATYQNDDTDDHIARFSSSGKGRFSFCVDNLADQDVTVTLYGAFSSDGDIGDSDVFAIDSTGIVALKTAQIYDTCSDPFPWFYVNCTSAVAGNDKAVTLFVCFMAY